MRTLEACREEIFLRSRRRIRRRKRIQWAVGMVCVPLLLAVVLLLPGSPKGTEVPLAEAVPDGSPPISALGDISVSVRLPGTDESVQADPMLAARLESFFAVAESATETPKEAPESASPIDGTYGENYSSPAPVIITCYSGQQELRYFLLGNRLTCEQLGETVTLSDDQRRHLEAYWTVE